MKEVLQDIDCCFKILSNQLQEIEKELVDLVTILECKIQYGETK